MLSQLQYGVPFLSISMAAFLVSACHHIIIRDEEVTNGEVLNVYDVFGSLLRTGKKCNTEKWGMGPAHRESGVWPEDKV